MTGVSGLPRGRAGLFEARPADILAAVDHARLRPLVDDAAHARWRALAGELAVPVHTVCYECRLADGDPDVDFAVAMHAMATRGPREVLGVLGDRRRGDPAWRRCLDFLAAWSDPHHAWAELPFVCAAFDAAAAPDAAPSLSLCIDRGFFARQLGLPAPKPAPAGEVVALVDACARALQAAPLDPDAAARITACLATDDVLARHVSFMVARAPATIKLDVRVPVTGVAALLHRLAWPDADRIAARVRALVPWRGHVQLNLVVHPTLSPTLEVELLTAPGEASLADRLAVLDHLVDAGACAAAKACVLRDAWTHPVSRAPGGTIIARGWYLKVKLAGDAIALAKAYLALMPRVHA